MAYYCSTNDGIKLFSALDRAINASFLDNDLLWQYASQQKPSVISRNQGASFFQDTFFTSLIVLKVKSIPLDNFLKVTWLLLLLEIISSFRFELFFGLILLLDNYRLCTEPVMSFFMFKL
jgi:hypothetical protein